MAALTATQLLLIDLMLSAAIREIFNKVSTMTPEEISAGIAVEQERKKKLMEEI
jgi:hypothetical protein